MTDDLDIPAFLRLTAEERRAGWAKHKAAPFEDRRKLRVSETERLYRASIERDKAIKRARDEQRWAELREKAAQDKAEREAVAEAVRKRGQS